MAEYAKTHLEFSSHFILLRHQCALDFFLPILLYFTIKVSLIFFGPFCSTLPSRCPWYFLAHFALGTLPSRIFFVTFCYTLPCCFAAFSFIMYYFLCILDTLCHVASLHFHSLCTISSVCKMISVDPFSDLDLFCHIWLYFVIWIHEVFSLY